MTKKIKILDFSATWCGPCLQMAPMIAQLEKELEGQDVEIVKINIDQEPELSQKYNVTAIPTLIYLVDDEPLIEERGARTKKQILDNIENLRK